MRHFDGSRNLGALQQEILKEMAEGLGRAGERLERAIQLYRELDAERDANTPGLERRLREQRSEVLRAREWLVIQREALGFRSHDEVLDAHYPLPFPRWSSG